MGGKISKQNVGNAGEYYVSSLLSAKDFVVTVTLGRNEEYDLIAVRKDGKVFKISVKTMQSKATHFILSKKYENISADDLFYFFVLFYDNEWHYWVVPSERVAHYTKESHQIWENTPGRNNKPHKKGIETRGFDLKQIKYSPDGWGEEVTKYYKNMNLVSGN